MTRQFRVLEVKPVPKGTPEYEATIQAIKDEFASKVPESLWLPDLILDNPPKNATSVPRDCGLLTPEELDITENYDAVALAEAIASKKFTAVAVATAFSKRAIIAHQLTRCLTEWFMDEAIEQAKGLDEYLEKTGKTIGPLHGVPLSVKEHQPIKGHYTALGFLDTRVLSDKDAQMVRIFREAGAVFYCKTMQPQGIMHLEGVSQTGRVLNPHNIYLTPGGSTAGEGALIAMRGSVMGIGTDIGGSIRGPSGMSGIYGFKPTSYVLPMKDFLTGGFGAELQVLCSTGPMTNTLRDMDLFVSVVKAANPHLEDPRVVPFPWTGLNTPPVNKDRPLKVGIMFNDGHIQPQPPVAKALVWAKEQLEKAAPGKFEVKEFKPFQAEKAMKLLRKAYWPDGGKAVKAHLATTGEPMFSLTEWVIKDAEKDTDSTSTEVLAERVARDDFRIAFSAHWESQDVDVLICPVFVGTACEHDTAFYWNYTGYFNYVDYPGAVVPTPLKALKKGQEEYAPEHQTVLSEEDKHVRELWAKGDFEDAPVCLQVVARKYYDNELFAALAQLKEPLQLP